MTNEKMAEDNRRDTKALNYFRAAVVALAMLARDEDVWERLRDEDQEAIVRSTRALEERAEHIEAVWN